MSSGTTTRTESSAVPTGDHGVERAALNAVVDAWEALPSGYHTPRSIERWMSEHLRPSIDRARGALGRSAP
jgi:hypothetical protein